MTLSAYFIDSAALAKKYHNKMQSYFDDEQLKPFYKKVTESKIIDRIVYKELKMAVKHKNNQQDKYNFSLLPEPVEQKTQFFGLDGDKTGSQLENLLLDNSSENKIKEFSEKIAEAVKEIEEYIKSKPGSDVIFARGDDILFKGSFTGAELEYMKKLYEEKTGGETCSIAYGSSVREVLLAMKMAKIQRNSIRGISLSD